MQKLIAKYGTAAHLALLAVAPQCLYPFFGVRGITAAVLWLAPVVAVWILHEPSVLVGERVRDSRRRVLGAILHDPLFWTLTVVAVVAAAVWLNSGVVFAYDAENQVWRLTEPALEFIPGSCRDGGRVPFLAAVSSLVVIVGVRHAIGMAGRSAFLLVSSVLTAITAFTTLVLVNGGAKPVPGMVYGVAFLAALAVLPMAFERDWNLAIPLLVVAIAGNAAGIIAFTPARVSALFGIAMVPVVAYDFVYVLKRLRGTVDFKLLIAVSISLVIGGFAVYALLPDRLSELAAVYSTGDFLPDGLMTPRKVLCSIARTSWLECPWAGTGAGTFPFDVRFHAAASDWSLIPYGTADAMHGWWFALAEGGIVRLAFLTLPFCFLTFTYFRRAWALVTVRELPHPDAVAGPVALMVVVAAEFFGCDFARPEVFTLTGALLAASAAAFPVANRRMMNG